MEPTRLFELFDYQQEKYPQTDSIVSPLNGKWVKRSTQDMIDAINSVALGLLDLGLKKGDMIAIMSINRAEWTIVDSAIMKMGGIVVPIYPTSAVEDLEYIFNHAGMKAAFVQDKELYEKLHGLKDKMPTMQHYYTLDKVDGAKHWEELKTKGTPEKTAALNEIAASVDPMELATIIYTSGTTGNPKGVMLSHNNIIFTLKATEDMLPVGSEHIALSFLPLSHIFERMINYLYFYVGVSVYFGESIEKIGDNLKEVRPHVFTAVPRLLEKVFDKIQAGGMANTGLKKTLFEATTKLALQWQPDGQNGWWYNFRLNFLDKLVASKIRAKAGLDRVVACASGSAALQTRLLHFFNGIGLPLVEGYGLTETSPVISVGGFNPGELKVGTVGRVIQGGHVKIEEDGEITYKGPNVMLGYYKNEEMTKEVINDNQYFHTGDIGTLDKDGFLKITDRKKAIFKTSGGKYIRPQVIENLFKASIYIEQIVVVGEYRKFASALVVPNFEALTGWAQEKGLNINEQDRNTLIAHPEVQNLYQGEMEIYNATLPKYEKIKKIELLPQELTIDGGELTPTLKVKRKIVISKYADSIEKIYDGL